MYRNYKSVENITSFEVKNNYLQYVKGNSLFINDKIIDNNTDCIGVFIDEIYFVYSNYSDFKSRIYNIEKNEIFKIVDYNIQNLKSNFGYLAYNYDEKFNSNLLILNSDFNIQNNTNLLNTTISLVKGNIGIQKFNNTQIHAYTLPTAQPLWQFNLGVLGTYQDSNGETLAYEVQKIIGVWNNQLLVACKNGMLLSVDIENGKLLHHWQYFNNQENEKAYGGDKIPDTIHFQLDKTNNTLIAAAYRSFTEIDLQSRKITVTDLKDQLEIHGALSFYSTSENSFNDTHLFCTVVIIEKPDNIFKNGIAAINRHTKKIEWFFTDKIFGTGTNAPTLSGDKLYQLTLDNILYIFQKENPST
jgi:hypothetical protein